MPRMTRLGTAEELSSVIVEPEQRKITPERKKDRARESKSNLIATLVELQKLVRLVKR
jgi:hypothetical protein